MAIFSSHLMADARGSVSGTTFSKNKGGNYIRRRVKGLNPQTGNQSIARGQFAGVASAWRNLTSLQRVLWNAAADNVTRQNKLGQEYTPSGFQLFQEVNTNLVSIGESINVAPGALEGTLPFEFNWAEFDTGTNDIAFDTDVPSGTDDMVAQFVASVPRQAGVSRVSRGRMVRILNAPAAAAVQEPDAAENYAERIFNASVADVFNELAEDDSRVIFVAQRWVNSVSGIASPWQQVRGSIVTL